MPVEDGATAADVLESRGPVPLRDVPAGTSSLRAADKVGSVQYSAHVRMSHAENDLPTRRGRSPEQPCYTDFFNVSRKLRATS